MEEDWPTRFDSETNRSPILSKIFRLYLVKKKKISDRRYFTSPHKEIVYDFNPSHLNVKIKIGLTEMQHYPEFFVKMKIVRVYFLRG